MKNFRKITLGFLVTTILLPSFYGCSNDNESSTTYQKEGLKKEARIRSRDLIIKNLANDIEFVEFLNETYHLMDNVNPTILLKYSSIDRDMTNEEGLEFSHGFGFNSIQEFESFFTKNLTKLNNVSKRYEFESIEKADLDYILIGAIEQVDKATSGDYCKLQRKGCRSAATNAYTQDVLACAGAGGMIAALSAGSLSLLGAGVAFGCVGYAAYNFDTQIDICEANYKRCK